MLNKSQLAVKKLLYLTFSPYCPHKYAKKSARHQRSSADFSKSLIKFFFFLNRLVSMFNSTARYW